MQIALLLAPAVFVGPFDGPGWTSCVLWTFAAVLLRIIDTFNCTNCVVSFVIFLSMVTAISFVDGEFAAHFSH
jgi:hypothetical protein